MSAIGSKIRNLRLQLSLSQRQLAGKEMTRAFISLVESGRATPSCRTLSIIAQRLGKPLEYFLADERDKDGLDLGGMIFKEAQRKAEAGEIEPALKLLYQVLKVTHNQHLRAATHDLLRICLTHLGRFEEALSECKEALASLRAIGDQTGIVQAYLQMGALASALEDFPGARKAYEEAVRRSRGLKRSWRLYLEALTNLGTTLICLGELPEAISAYEEAFQESSRQRDLAQMGLAALGLGRALLDSGLVEESLQWTQRAIDLLGQAQSQDKTVAIHQLGRALAARGDHDEAYRIYQECLAVYREEGLVDRQASILEDLARYWIHRGDLPQAKACFREALDLLDARDDGNLRGRLYRVLGAIAQKEGNTEYAYYFLRMSYDLLRRMKASREASRTLEAIQDLRVGYIKS